MFGYFAHACFNDRRYEEASRWARKSLQQHPDHALAHMVLAATLGHLDRETEARQALDEALRLRPAFAENAGLVLPYKNAEDREHYLDGLRKAGWDG